MRVRSSRDDEGILYGKFLIKCTIVFSWMSNPSAKNRLLPSDARGGGIAVAEISWRRWIYSRMTIWPNVNSPRSRNSVRNYLDAVYAGYHLVSISSKIGQISCFIACATCTPESWGSPSSRWLICNAGCRRANRGAKSDGTRDHGFFLRRHVGLWSDTGRVRETGNTPSSPLTLIAAHALSLDVLLTTNNTREFARVPGLSVEDWTLT